MKTVTIISNNNGVDRRSVQGLPHKVEERARAKLTKMALWKDRNNAQSVVPDQPQNKKRPRWKHTRRRLGISKWRFRHF
eukprot:gene2524-5444_t